MAKPTWKLQKILISDIKEFENNPRWLTQKAKSDLKKSIERFGLIDKPILNSDKRLIGGHQRIQVLLEQGEKEIECYVSSRKLNDKEFQELNIRLNKNGGTWDFESLANNFDCSDLLAWGFDEKELLGEFDEPDVSDTEESTKEEKEIELQTCPQCGHKFK